MAERDSYVDLEQEFISHFNKKNTQKFQVPSSSKMNHHDFISGLLHSRQQASTPQVNFGNPTTSQSKKPLTNTTNWKDQVSELI